MSYDLFWQGNKLESSPESPLSFDTETEVIEDKSKFPRFVLATAYDGKTNCVIGPHQLVSFLLTHEDSYFVGHNVAFDFWVVMTWLDKQVPGPSQQSDLYEVCKSILWNAAKENRVCDTMLLDQLVWLAKGKGESNKSEEDGARFFRRGLDSVVKEYLNKKVDKKIGNEQGEYRTRFAELLGIPWENWKEGVDPGFFEYATTDTVVTWEVYRVMRQQARALQAPFLSSSSLAASHGKVTMYPDAVERYGVLTEAIQVKGAIALSKISQNGLRVDKVKASKLEAEIRKEFDEFIPFLEENFPQLLQPFKKKEGYKVAEKSGVPCLKNKEIQKLFEDWYPEMGLESPLKSKGKTGGTSVSVKDWSPFKDKQWSKAQEKNEFIKRWVNARTLSKRLSFFDLFKGGDFLHPDYNVLVRTGRTSCIAKGTLIEVVRDVSMYPKGKPIEDVKPGELAYGFTNEGRLTLRKVLWSGKTGHRKIIRIHWKGTGKNRSGFLDLTEEHPVRLIDGSYVPAGYLQVGARISSLSRGVSQGYAKLYPSGAREISREHRFIMEEVEGVCGEHVHHKNGNKLDNRIENLENMDAVTHLKYHGVECSPGLRKFRSEEMKRRIVEGGGISPPAGPSHPCRKNLSRDEIYDALENSEWSVVKAARRMDTDFDTFKKYAKEHGIDLVEMKKKSISVRKVKIESSAAYARACKNNHEVIRIERLPDSVDVYDLEVEDIHNFIANELCVHNCEKPNTQQLPRVQEFRECFVPRPGFKMVTADYAAIELRTLGTICKSKFGYSVLLDTIKSGVDPHAYTAAMFEGMSLTDFMALKEKDPKRFKNGRQAAKACFASDVEVLTTDGWVKVQNLTFNHHVQCFDPRTNKMSWHKPLALTRRERKKVVRVTVGDYTIRVTEDHRMLGFESTAHWFECQAHEFHGCHKFGVYGYHDNLVRMVSTWGMAKDYTDLGIHDEVFCLTVPTSFVVVRDCPLSIPWVLGNCNFGVPGGLGKVKLSEYAKANYGVTMSHAEAEKFRTKLITDIYPELKQYLASTEVEDMARNLKLSDPGKLYDFIFDSYGDPGMICYCLQQVLDGKPFKKDGTPYNPKFVDSMWRLAGELLSLSPNPEKVPFLKDVEKREPNWKLVKFLFGGTAVTLTGRIRKGVRFTEAKNSPFQGLAADGGKLALFEMVRRGKHVVGFIHDEVLVEVNKDEGAQEVEAIMVSCMEDVLDHQVGVSVEYNVGDSWSK